MTKDEGNPNGVHRLLAILHCERGLELDGRISERNSQSLRNLLATFLVRVGNEAAVEFEAV